MQIKADVRQLSVKVYVSYRYWLFSDEVPGLFIEKGWVHDSIDYRFVLPHQKKEDSRKDCSPGGMLSPPSVGVLFVAVCSNGLVGGRELSSPSWGYSEAFFRSPHTGDDLLPDAAGLETAGMCHVRTMG